MGTRKTTVVHEHITAEQAEEAFAEYATATSGIKKLSAEMELKITAVREKYQDALAALAKRQEATNSILMTYAMENEQLFDKKKSIELTHGKIGFRTGTPKVKNLKGFTWASVKNLVKELLGEKFVRTEEEVNKEALLAERDNPEVNQHFKKCGIEIRQDETFFVEPKEETSMAGMAVIIALILCLSIFKAGAQDTIITTPAYTSYFNYSFKGPDSVVYKLYRGGGNCSRAAYRFKNDIPGLHTATEKDFLHSGYDEGHMANAEDFAGNCELEETTFRYYNQVPQTPQLNRGPWKHWETLIRHESQTDSLLITCGNVWSDGAIGNGVTVPAICWKKVVSLTTGAVIHAIVCSNTSTPVCDDLTIEGFTRALSQIK
jgi:phage host-nuclease inhibitor protein Gam